MMCWLFVCVGCRDAARPWVGKGKQVRFGGRGRYLTQIGTGPGGDGSSKGNLGGLCGSDITCAGAELSRCRCADVLARGCHQGSIPRRSAKAADPRWSRALQLAEWRVDRVLVAQLEQLSQPRSFPLNFRCWLEAPIAPCRIRSPSHGRSDPAGMESPGPRAGVRCAWRACRPVSYVAVVTFQLRAGLGLFAASPSDGTEPRGTPRWWLQRTGVLIEAGGDLEGHTNVDRGSVSQTATRPGRPKSCNAWRACRQASGGCERLGLAANRASGMAGRANTGTLAQIRAAFRDNNRNTLVTAGI
jgi:hypothetical protein